MWMEHVLPWLGLKRFPTRHREAGMGDCPGLARIHAASFAQGWDTLEFERFMATGALADVLLSRGFFGELVTGFALSQIVAGEAELLTIALDPEVRGKGHAAPLLEAHCARLRRAGAECLFLEVAEDNAPALALYRALGFAEIGRRKGYYAGAGGRRDALTMRRDLTPLDPVPRVF